VGLACSALSPLLHNTSPPHTHHTQEQLLQREHRKETKRQIKREAAALDQQLAPEDEEQLKAHVVTYCALDYPRLVDALRYRLETMKRNVKVGGWGWGC